ncbi:MAG: adenylosuccinate lyase [Tenericutes bacterium GWC2_34_14]|nr:MAG: adenylosuccinate lyase [Tenericutes bacterium GWA2_35_7]OHE29328.1 MAG: adenylosuccinate lyase [Tenericutes bacterium GWC2_34_14]OHE34425.1 MAG: adenylosuccinate lyase [Tenericutes bacterium GWE2_34_108]OHE35781.1 MAG: adenylosuccinate lyase [Tenericutes bacterium GWF1_35_14]OHE39132.1 MAG: adenylosuccinate lyase [Tenericutes bacterium GWF2_35_184]OHE42382.1 MAG: adenylosuccinate lyase [Tenericutes bacterium RIFOXYA12_FULL_35_10]OHE42801.1 MAG: adenylosuccinate lyase [Tenericutes bact
MISRYQRLVMQNLWSDETKFKMFLKVELAASYAWMKKGLFDEKAYKALEKATFDLNDIVLFEEETKHDVIAFTKAVTKTLGDEKKWFHYGLTSTDVVDSAQSLILKEVNQIILDDIDQLMDVLKVHAFQFKKTPCMGRTHGIHAEVTSFGLKFALWYEDFKRLKQHFVQASEDISVIKLSGAVGNFSGNHPDIQKIAAKKLGLKESHIATQTLQRDRHANYMSSLALIASELEKMAVEIRHLARTEVGEVSEYFSEFQKGSSAMPHKKNPISSENITGLSRVVRGYMVSSFENIALWHERDISHSSVERIILSDATSLVDYMLHRYKNTLESLNFYPEKMRKNIELTQGVIFAQSILSHLIQKGMHRDDAYTIVQSFSHQALSENKSLRSLIEENQTLKPFISEDDFNNLFNLEKHLIHVDYIFERVFGSHILS